MNAIGTTVIVRPFKKDGEKTESGIIIPDTLERPLSQGEVLSVGDEVKYLKAGDKIVFSPLYYDEIDENTISMLEKHVSAKID